MRSKMLALLLIFTIGISIAGCGNILDKMNRLSVSMNKNDVRSLFGTTFVAKASKVDASGNVLDLWEFYDKKTKSTYQIYFLNDKISQWGKSEDLKSFPELYAPGTANQSK